jgi:uncharacterized protein YqeY
MLTEKIRLDLTAAIKGKKSIEVATLRLLWAEIHNQEMAKQKPLTEEEVVAVIRSQIKKRREAIELYRQGKREDLVRKEQEEMVVLEKYLPQQIPAGEMEKIVKETISETGAGGPGDFGKVMGVVMGKVKGKADGSTVSQIVKKLLDSSS